MLIWGYVTYLFYSPAKFTKILLSCSSETHIIFKNSIILNIHILDGCGIETI